MLNRRNDAPLISRVFFSSIAGSINPCESMIECVRRSARNIKCWRDGQM